ncbi:MAG TPA: condensation domain-containing protein, partial [Pyrinomonadaceae bacterium]|nr:condensation domain-containing protein [Pyrinomonadaceae bacterium]
LGEEEHVALFTMHHIISDGWSVGVFVKELAAEYEAFVTGQPSPLPELEIQYADFAHWQRTQLQGDALNAQLAYWKQQLAGAPAVLKLPVDRMRGGEKVTASSKQPLALTPELSESLKTLSRQTGSTVFMTLLGAFQILLRHHSGTDDILVGTDVANRNRVEVENLIGFFINQLVLRTDLSGNPSFAELLERVRETTFGAYAHQDTPFDRLVEALKVERSLEYSPLFQVKFVYQNAPMPPLELADLKVEVLGIESGTTKVDLQLTLWEEKDGLKGWLEYNAHLFEATTIARLNSQFVMLLNAILAQPQLQLSDLEQVLKDADRQFESIASREIKESRSQKFKTIRRKAIGIN